MKKNLKTTLFVAVGLVVAGLLLYGAGFALGGWSQMHEATLWGISFGPSVSTGFGNYGRDWDSAYREDNSYSVSSQGLRGVDVSWISGTADVAVYDGDSVTFTESSSRESIVESTALRYGVKDGVLHIQYCPKNPPRRLPEKSLTVNIPKALASGMDSFAFDGISAELTVSGLTADRFGFDSVSGRLQASGISASNVELSATSGAMAFEGAYSTLEADSTSGKVTVTSLGNAAATSIDATSGAISLSGACGALSIDATSGAVSGAGPVTADVLRFDSTSGALNLSGSFGQVHASSISGRIDLASDVCPQELNAETTSGAVNITVPRDSGLTLRYDTVSGKMRSDLSMVMDGSRLITGDGSADFRVDTISGDLNLLAR